MSVSVATLARSTPPLATAAVWLRRNLFSSVFSGAVTIILGAALAWLAVNGMGWVLFTADWEVVTSRVPLYLVGLYPHEAIWRPQVCVLLVSGLLGMSWRMWGGTARIFAIGFSVITLVVGVLPHEMAPLNRVLLLLNPVAVGLVYLIAKRLLVDRLRRIVAVSISTFVVMLLLIHGIEGVPGLEPVNPQDIGGLMLNLVLATFGIAVSMPIGIALALGRRSNLPVVKVVCVAFIEIVRGAPLITLLFMSRHLLPLTFPENFQVSGLYLAAITITLFSSAYMAENVRGGMAAVSPGQTEAARALGLRAGRPPCS